MLVAERGSVAKVYALTISGKTHGEINLAFYLPTEL